VQVTAFLAAAGFGLVLRSATDIAIPISVGDDRKIGRHVLQWCLVVGLAVLMSLALSASAGAWFIPNSDGFGPWLRFVLGCDGAMFFARYAVRIVLRQLRPAAPGTPPIPELVARLPVDPNLPSMAPLEPVAPDPWRLSRSNVPGALCGALMLGLALIGWNTSTVCLLRLPP
jgi:hypothetical protein